MLTHELVPTRIEKGQPRRTFSAVPLKPPGRARPLRVLYQVLALSVWMAMTRISRRFNYESFARRVREFLESTGPVWVQLGKVLAMRSDLLPGDLALELAKLRDVGQAFPFEFVRETVEEELGAPFDQYFDQCEREPFATSSCFQVHRARLRSEDCWVAIKVQRPYNDVIFKRDIRLVRAWVRLMRWLRISPNMRWDALFREVEEFTQRELDFRFEAAALDQLGKVLPAQFVHVPEVFFAFSTRRVLVSEFIPGVTLEQYNRVKQADPAKAKRWLEENEIDPQHAARRLFDSVFRQIFEDNFFHADLHPSNVILLRESRLALIDCRTIGSLEAEQLRKYRMFFSALARREFATAAEHSFLFAYRLPRTDLGEVKVQFTRIWRQWEGRNHVRELPNEEKSITWMLHEMNQVAYQFRFEVHWSMVKLAWALINADASVLSLVDRIDYIRWLRRYFREANRRANQFDSKEAVRSLTMLIDAMIQLPKSAIESSVAQQEVIRRQNQVFRSSTLKSSFLISTIYGFIATATLCVGVWLGGAFLYQHFQVDVRRWFGEQLFGLVAAVPAMSLLAWMVVLGLLLAFYLRTVVYQRRSRQGDVVGETRAPT